MESPEEDFFVNKASTNEGTEENIQIKKSKKGSAKIQDADALSKMVDKSEVKENVIEEKAEDEEILDKKAKKKKKKAKEKEKEEKAKEVNNNEKIDNEFEEEDKNKSKIPRDPRMPVKLFLCASILNSM